MGRGGRKGKGASGSSVASQVIPAEEAEYYDQLQEKHFSKDAVGSRFTADTLHSLLDRNPQLLGNEDDRQAFLRMGVPEEALLPGRSYFLLRAPGEEGMVAADRLDPETPISIVRAKDGSLSLVVRGQDHTPTQVATAIVGDYPRDPSRRALITVFPGLPADPDRSLVPEENDLGLRDGQTMPLRELQNVLGRDDLLLQVSSAPRQAPVIERSDPRVLDALRGAPVYQKDRKSVV